MKEMIKARLVFEAQGKPPKHLEQTMKKMVDKIRAVQGVEVFDVKEEPAILVKGTDLYSGLVDVGIQTEKFDKLFFVVLSFGPSAIIVLEPDHIDVKVSELQLALNDLSQVLHGMANEALTSKMQLIHHLKQTKAKK
jgi:hypothetical protein